MTKPKTYVKPEIKLIKVLDFCASIAACGSAIASGRMSGGCEPRSASSCSYAG